MKIKFLVQIPGRPHMKAVELLYSGDLTGAELEVALCKFLGVSDHHWAVAGQPLSQLTVSQAPLVSGAMLESIAPDTARSAPDPLLIAEVLHGPDSRSSFPLSRGSWSLGRYQSDITIADPAIKPLEATLQVHHTGVHYVVGSHRAQVNIGEPFKVGNSVLKISSPTLTDQAFEPIEEQEIDVPAARSKMVILAMVIFPLVIGLTIALLTGMWLILAMSVGSSALMALHAFSSGGESRSTRRLVEEAAVLDTSHARTFSTGAPATEALVLGHHTRPVKIRGKNRELEVHPWIDTAPYEISVSQVGKILDALPLATQRLVLAYLVNAFSGLSVLLATTDSPGYRQLVEPLLSQPNVEPLFEVSGAASPPMICENLPVQAPPQENIFVLGSAGAFDSEKVKDLGKVYFDGISETTFYRMLGKNHRSGHILSTETQLFLRTSEIALFNQGYGNQPHDIRFYAGADPHTGEPLVYGLNSHGPHFLCAGTTGAGKSQFLRSVLWSMALKTPPEQLRFVLVDFKGGAGLAPLAQTPHSAAFITDLQASGLARSLKYLRADLQQRELAFSAVGVSSYKDYAQYCRQQGKELDLPEIVICIDEFKMLVDHHPTAMNEFMRVATVGRSLGYHLFLATQRPQGTVSPEIRANIATAFCLRVSSAQDSYNVLSSEDAANIPAHKPGFGYVKDSENHVLAFQAPLIDGLYRAAETILYSLKWAHESSAGLILNQDSTAAGLSDQAFSALCAQLPPAATGASYTPILPPLTPLPTSRHSKARGLLLGQIEVADCGTQVPWAWSQDDGAILCVGSVTERTQHVLMLIRQALSQGQAVLCFSTSEHVAHRIRSEISQPDLPCFVYSFKDFDFVRGLVMELQPDGPPLLLIIDGFDTLQDSLARYPDFEAKLLDLFTSLGTSTIRTFGTASLLPRGKFHQVFDHVLFSASYLESDPIRSHQKDYNRPLPGQFSVEGKRVQQLAGDSAESGVMCFAHFDEDLSILPPPAPGIYPFQQFPPHISWQPPSTTSLASLTLGYQRNNTPVLLPDLHHGFIAVSGKRASGKTAFLRAFRQLNPLRPSLYVSSKTGVTVEHFREVLEKQGKAPHQKPIVCLDDLHLMSDEVQRFILESKELFSTVVICYTPWPRWSTSPILSALAGTETGIVLAPETAADLNFYPGATLPWDLRSEGKVPVGRGVLIDHGQSTAFHFPLPPVSHST